MYPNFLPNIKFLTAFPPMLLSPYLLDGTTKPWYRFPLNHEVGYEEAAHISFDKTLFLRKESDIDNYCQKEDKHCVPRFDIGI